MNKLQKAEQFRKVVQLFASSLSDEKALEVATVFDPWTTDKAYSVGDFLTYGVNGVGDPQLYKVVQAHTSRAEWTPDTVRSLYSPIGLDDSGYPVWSQPTGAHDAYNTGDIVNFEGELWVSTVDANAWAPGVYGWEKSTV